MDSAEIHQEYGTFRCNESSLISVRNISSYAINRSLLGLFRTKSSDPEHQEDSYEQFLLFFFNVFLISS